MIAKKEKIQASNPTPEIKSPSPTMRVRELWVIADGIKPAMIMTAPDSTMRAAETSGMGYLLPR
jgi:hypothetical protein